MFPQVLTAGVSMGRIFRELLAGGELVRVFSVGRYADSVTIDLFGLAGGYHGFWIDQEHVGLDYREVQTAAVAARANGFDCFVRMPPVGYWQVTQNLEAGAAGVMAAQINSAAEAEQFVRWAKFAPRGLRGMNTSGRDANYTHMGPTEFAESANREHLVLIQIETVGAAEEADAIAAIDGVDLLFVGPTDMAQALGITGQLNHEKNWEAITRVADACRRHGKHWGTVPADPEFASRCYDLGCRMLTLGGDVRAMRAGIDAAKSDYRKWFPS